MLLTLQRRGTPASPLPHPWQVTLAKHRLKAIRHYILHLTYILLTTSYILQVTLAKHGLASLVAACKMSGTCETLRHLFMGEDRKLV